jgi:hypothetical protein
LFLLRKGVLLDVDDGCPNKIRLLVLAERLNFETARRVLLNAQPKLTHKDYKHY